MFTNDKLRKQRIMSGQEEPEEWANEETSLKEKASIPLSPKIGFEVSESAKNNFMELVGGLDSQLKPVTPFDDSKSNYDKGYDRIFNKNNKDSHV